MTPFVYQVIRHHTNDTDTPLAAFTTEERANKWARAHRNYLNMRCNLDMDEIRVVWLYVDRGGNDQEKILIAYTKEKNGNDPVHFPKGLEVRP